MPPSKQLAAYAVEVEILIKALESQHGLRLRPGKGEPDPKKWGIRLRHRLNSCREADRIRSREIHPLGDPRHGRSAYDGLVFSMREDAEGVYVEVQLGGFKEGDIRIEEI